MSEMMGGYDRAIVTFSPDGRLFQVEYAREAIKRGTMAVGVIFKDGVVLAAVRKFTGLSIPSTGSDKVQQIDDHLGAAITGFLADGRVLIDSARVKAQVFRLTYDEPIDVLGSVRETADRMQLFTQYGGVRPFAVALLMGGMDSSGPHLYEVDPSATFYRWKAHAVGRGSAEAIKILKREWKESLTRDAAMVLALKAIKAGEKGLKPNDVELVVVTKDKFEEYHGDKDAKVIRKFW